MEPKKRRKTKGTVIIGRGAATVRIYPIIRKNGYPQNTVCWKEGGRRPSRCFACMEEAKMVAQQISVRLTNGWSLGDEVTRRDIEILRHCEGLARQHGTELVAAVEEWASARKTAGPIPLADAVRFYAANRIDIFPSRTVAQVAEEFVESLRCKGVSDAYVRNAKLHLKGFTAKVSGEIADVTVAHVNGYLNGLKTLGPVSRNGIRRNIVTMFGFAKRQGYLHPDRKTAAEQSETFKEHETEIQIFTPEEMGRLLLTAHARILPLLAIGAFAGIQSAEIHRLEWEDIKLERGHIEIAGKKAKTAARRLVPLTDIMARCSCRFDAARLREEQAAIGHPLSLRIRLSQLESKLRQGFSAIGDQLRTAIGAAPAHVTTAAGGHDAVRSFPFARRHLEELALHRTMPTTASTAGRLVFIRSAWLAMDAAMASLGEIRFDARLRRESGVRSVKNP